MIFLLGDHLSKEFLPYLQRVELPLDAKNALGMVVKAIGCNRGNEMTPNADSLPLNIVFNVLFGGIA